MEVQSESVAYCQDGVGGKVSHVLIDQRSWKAAYLVVRETHSGGEDWIVPLRLLDSTGRQEVRLNCTLEGLHQCEHFTVFELLDDPLYEQAGCMAIGPGTYAVLEAVVRQAQSQNIPPGCLSLALGEHVACDDGQLGRISAVRFDTKHHMLSALVIQQGYWRFKKEFAIPARSIERIEMGEIHLNVDRCQVESLLAMH